MSETAKAPVDVFAKVREHDRLEQLEAAKEHDLLPYFRLLTSQAGPVVEMEGRRVKSLRLHGPQPGPAPESKSPAAGRASRAS